MRRLAPAAVCAALISLFVVSCEDSQVPTRPDAGSISPAIWDGQFEGNSHFYFLPPMVPSPTYNGTFTGSVHPAVEICELAGDPADPTDPTNRGVVCGDGDADGTAFFRRFEPSEVELRLDDELYVAHWNTEPDHLQTEDVFYRVFVLIEDIPRHGDIVLGFADVDVAATQEDLKQIDVENFVPLLIDRTLPIKFRIESGFFCEAIGGGENCGEGLFTQNGGSATNADGTAGLFAEALPVEEGEEVFVAVENVNCETDGDGSVNLMDVDFPQRGNCVKITTSQQITGPITPLSIVGLCLDPGSLPPFSESWYGLRASNPFDPSADDVYVGPHRNAVGALSLVCDDAGSASANKFLNYALRGWKAIKRLVNPLDAVPVYADHTGKGSGWPEYSHFDWGYLTQMRKVPGVDGLVIAGDTTLNPEVLVTNAEDQPAAGTSITFAGDGTLGSPVTVPSDGDGISSVEWSVGPTPGTYQLTASALGVGVHSDDGGSGLQTPPDDDQRLLVEESLTFEVTVCAPGSGFGVPQAIDGVVTDEEYECAKRYPFFANISGGGSDADLFYMNDNEYLYLAVRFTRDESDKDNAVQFNFHKVPSAGADITGVAAAGDNVIALDAANGPTTIIDGYLPASCVNKKQSSCFDLDTNAGGSVSGMARFSNDGTYNMYEFQIPLNPSAGADAGLDLNVVAGDQLGFYMVVQLGKGAQGNTEVLGFRDYLIHDVQ